jgi:hypothetical protein
MISGDRRQMMAAVVVRDSSAEKTGRTMVARQHAMAG